MDLENQLKILIDEAPQYGISPIIIQKAIAPVLQLFAEQLQHSEYYILQNLEENWVLTTIANSDRQQKKVIYAFTSVRDAATFQANADPSIIAAAIPVTHLLFRLFSLEQVDSIFFLNDSHNLNTGIEVRRDRLFQLIQQQLQQITQVPPDIA
ncbi:hypothetical protein [Myxosarcina sp. GI1]|uniref:hypothetical protein n=1 Tax=Myxosarcina sp. GI1 TaxID=1541065 RepID=UPI00055E1900|nr:hypothetical protein [Myxosarcina sp. GI1]